ncbi:uncharacterized protein [Agelaius tricolor]|uniref:uncharacterized protein n=1 Tax=Agelaius tricolor TaxID=9191 RepID=UPI0039F21145
MAAVKELPAVVLLQGLVSCATLVWFSRFWKIISAQTLSSACYSFLVQGSSKALPAWLTRPLLSQLSSLVTAAAQLRISQLQPIKDNRDLPGKKPLYRYSASQKGYRIDPGQELLALGVNNVLGSFVSSYPIKGSFGPWVAGGGAGHLLGLCGMDLVPLYVREYGIVAGVLVSGVLLAGPPIKDPCSSRTTPDTPGGLQPQFQLDCCQHPDQQGVGLGSDSVSVVLVYCIVYFSLLFSSLLKNFHFLLPYFLPAPIFFA